jgi:hypothetical protein
VLLLKIAIIIVLLLLFIQDLLARSVYWFLFPLLIAGLIGVGGEHLSFAERCEPTLINLMFLALQLVVLSLYFSLKHKKWVNITRELIGIGDVLFLFSIAFYCSTLNYLFFYIISLITVLLCWLIFQGISANKNRQIPLAGLQSLIFAVFLAGDWWLGLFNLTDDAWLLLLIAK